jgi:hypothetical protein
MNTDPIGYADGPNLYGYLSSNPTNSTDPYGLAGPLLILVPILTGAATSVAIGFTLTTLTGGCYTWKDALTDAAFGAITGGGLLALSKLLQHSARLRFGQNLYWHGKEALVNIKNASGGFTGMGFRQWATTQQIASGGRGFGGAWSWWGGRRVYEATYTFKATEVPRLLPAYTTNFWTWWKGAQGQFVTESLGTQAYNTASGVSSIDIIVRGVHGIFTLGF